MTTPVKYYNSQRLSFDSLFMAASGGNGVSDPSYMDHNGNPLVYAAVSAGSPGPAVGYARTDGLGDLATLWAASGSAPPLVDDMGFGIYNESGEYGTIPSDSSFTGSISGTLSLNFVNDGTWNIQLTTTTGNSSIDTAMGNFPSGTTIDSGIWAVSPGAGIGSDYEITGSVDSATAGWENWDNSSGSLSPNATTGWPEQSGTVVNTHPASLTHASLATTQSFVLTFSGTASGSSSPTDINLRWSLQVLVNVTIQSTGGGDSVTATDIPLGLDLVWVSITGNGHGGGGGGMCVANSMYLLPELLAGDVEAGDWIDGVAYNPDCVQSRMVEAVKFGLQPCWYMKTVSGIELIASESTPMIQYDGSIKLFPEMFGELVIVDDDGDVRWERVTELYSVGEAMVAYISMDNQNYFAGASPTRRIGSHNVPVKN